MVGMRTYRRAAQTVYEWHDHFVFTPQSRKPGWRGEIARERRDVIRQIWRGNEIEISAGHVRLDPVQLRLSVPPQLAPRRVRPAIKSKPSHHLLSARRKLRQEFWGQPRWALGSFVCSRGNVTDERIAAYLRNPEVEPPDDEQFKISA